MLSSIRCRREKSDEMKENETYSNSVKMNNYWSSLEPESNSDSELGDSADNKYEEIRPKKLSKGDSETRKTSIKYYNFFNVKHQ